MPFLPLLDLPATRRLVTSHDQNGKAILISDKAIHPYNPHENGSLMKDKPLGITLIHRTRSFPVKLQGGEEELGPENARRGQGELGIVCQVIDLPPMTSDQPLFLHRNQSLDYGVVLKGSMQIVLDDGVVETLHEGDVFVQKGTMHAWKNLGDGYCRFLTIVIPSEQVRVPETGALLEATKIPALSD